MTYLLRARRRYELLRQELDPDLETDRALHDDLSAAIREIDRKIARLQLRPALAPRRTARAPSRPGPR